MMMRPFHSLALVAGLALATPALAQTDPLPSWNDTPTKAAILEFVTRVTSEGGPDFVPVADRIATFDNDGTLWVEHPIYTQLAFALDQVKALAAKNDHIKVEAIDARVKAAVSVQSGHIKEFGMAAQCGQEARDGFSSGLTLAATGAAKK